MAEQPYHKYVFDLKAKRFVGKFEEMYADEDRGGYDSWFQEDITYLTRPASLLLLGRYNFKNVLDIGCGKGVFTHLLKKKNNRVIGTDISATALKKARSRCRDVTFRKMSARSALGLAGRWDLVVMMEVLSYLKDWRELLLRAAEKSGYIFVSLYIPPDPVGYVKSLADLRQELSRHFRIEDELLWNREHLMVLGRSKRGGSVK